MHGKMDTRYSKEQIDFLAACSILDIRINIEGNMKHHVDAGFEFLAKEAEIHFDSESQDRNNKAQKKQEKQPGSHLKVGKVSKNLFGIYDIDDDSDEEQQLPTDSVKN